MLVLYTKNTLFRFYLKFSSTYCGEGYCLYTLLYLLRASSHLAGRTERPNPKLLSKSSLKYIICVLLSDFDYFIEKKFDLSTRVWISIFDAPKLFSRGQTLGAKSAKKCCHVGTLEAFHLWSLATSVKAQRSTSRLSTNHSARFLHLSNRMAKCEDPLRPWLLLQLYSQYRCILL